MTAVLEYVWTQKARIWQQFCTIIGHKKLEYDSSFEVLLDTKNYSNFVVLLDTKSHNVTAVLYYYWTQKARIWQHTSFKHLKYIQLREYTSLMSLCGCVQTSLCSCVQTQVPVKQKSFGWYQPLCLKGSSWYNSVNLWYNLVSLWYAPVSLW